MSVTGWLFRLARLSANAKAISSGNPKKLARRGKNKVLGRLLGRASIWRRLWK